MHIFRRLLLLAVIPSVLLTTIFGIVFANKATAVYDPEKTTIAEASFSFQAYVFLTLKDGGGFNDDFACSDNWTGKIDASDVTKFNWFEFGGLNPQSEFRPGHLLIKEGAITRDLGPCQNYGNWLSSALSLWGWGTDYGQFLDDIGYTPQARNENGTTVYDYVNDGVDSASVSKAIRSKYYNGRDPMLTDAMKYWVYIQNFKIGCGGSTDTPPGDYANADPNNKNVANTDENANHFWTVIDENGTIQDTIWKTTLGRGDDVTTGFKVLPKQTDFETSCGQLAELLRNRALADAFVEEMKINQENKKSIALFITPGGQGNEGGSSSCGATGPLTWLVCPLTSGLADFAKWIGTMISNLLYTAPESIFSDQFKSAWNTFRNIGMALVLIAGLVMVISQAFGLEILDAYTIRKLMPRLALALVGMALSWPLLQILITAFNDLGLWAHDLILEPFKGLGYPAGFDAQNMINSVLEMGLVGGALVASGLLLGWAGIISLLGTIVLALLIGVLVLAVRQTIIVTAVLLAPLAIAAYVLPGTQKLWSFWKNTLLTSLVMFPIIMAFLAGGEALSRVSISQSGNDSLNLIALLIFFAPYFMLPFAFKMAGGLMSTIFSLANDKNRGIFDRLKKGRGERMNANIGKMKGGNRFRTTSRMGDVFNTRSKAAYDATQTIGLTRRSRAERREAYHANHGFHVASDIRKQHGDMMSDDGINRAILESDGTLGSVRANLAAAGYEGHRLVAATGTAERLLATGSRQDVMTAIALHNVSTGSGYKNQQHMMDTIANVAGENTELATKMLGAMRGEAKQVGRSDLVARFGAQNDVLIDEINRRAGHQNNGGTISADNMRDLALSSFNQTDVATIARDRHESVRAHTKAMQARIEILRTEPDKLITMDDNTTIKASDLADSLTAQLQNLTASTREYGALDRAHVAHGTSEAIGQDGVITGTKKVFVKEINQRTGIEEIVQKDVSEYSPEYEAHISRYGTIPGSTNDPNMQQPQQPKPPEE